MEENRILFYIEKNLLKEGEKVSELGKKVSVFVNKLVSESLLAVPSYMDSDWTNKHRIKVFGTLISKDGEELVGFQEMLPDGEATIEISKRPSEFPGFFTYSFYMIFTERPDPKAWEVEKELMIEAIQKLNQDEFMSFLYADKFCNEDLLDYQELARRFGEKV